MKIVQTKANHASQRKGQSMYFMVTLLHTTPPVWRLIETSHLITLNDLAAAIIVFMEWKGEHLYYFDRDQTVYGIPGHLDSPGREVINACNEKLNKLFVTEGDRMRFMYDLGDNWEHEVVLMGRGAKDVSGLPRCCAGSMACPPEDCGGIPGYESLKENPHQYRVDDDYRHRKFDPYVFSNTYIWGLNNRPIRMTANHYAGIAAKNS